MASQKQPVFDINSVPAVVPAEQRAAEMVRPVVPAPEPYSIPFPRKLGAPGKVWEYRTADGGLYGVVCRWDFETDGKPDKTIRPCIWNGQTWMMAGFGSGRPIYNLPAIAAHPGCPVLVVEGEKAADGAARYLPPGWQVTCWSGGVAALDYHDWSVLSGHRVVLWPDNDSPGVEAMAKLQEALFDLGVGAGIVPLPQGLPEKWDLGDELPRGKPSAITSLLARTLDAVRAPAPEPDPEPEQVGDSFGFGEDPLPAPQDGIDRWIEIRALGYDEGRFYLMSRNGKQIEEMTAQMLLSPSGLLRLVPDRNHWDRQYGNDKGKIDWEAAGSQLMAECYKAGVFDEERLRGLGVWMDQGRVVCHIGHALLVNGKKCDPVEIDSEYIYGAAKTLVREADLNSALSNDVGKLLRRACNLAQWENPIYGDFLAGWLATAVVCGGLKWRTHAWITGPSGAGKTTIMDQLVRKVLGPVAVYPTGQSSEPGIRGAIGIDARPVVFDEAEGRDGRDQERRNAVIQLMRQASSDSNSRIMKGAMGGGAVSYTIRSSFLLGSIGVGIREAADETRTVVLTLKSPHVDGYQERDAREAQYRELLLAIDALPDDLPQQLMARQVRLLPVLRANVETFSRLIALKLANRRIGDQLGTLLAGVFSLVTETPISDEAATRYLDGHDWTEWTATKQSREDFEIIRYLCAHKVMVDANGGRIERTIGELIQIALSYFDHGSITPEQANSTLKRNGIRVERDASETCPEPGVCIGVQHRQLDQIMAKSDYPQGYHRLLLRGEGCRLLPKAVRFAGVQCRAIYIPAKVFD